MKNWLKVAIVLSVLSTAAAVWLLPPETVLEEEKIPLVCQWSFSKSKSGVSVIKDPPPEMTPEELIESGMAFSIEDRKVLQCQPAGFTPPSEPSQRSSGTYVLNE